MSADTDEWAAVDPGMNVHIELARFGLSVDVSTSGAYNPDQLDDMTTRAQRLLKSIADEYVAIVNDLNGESADEEEELDDFVEHDGQPPAGDLVTEVPNPT